MKLKVLNGDPKKSGVESVTAINNLNNEEKIINAQGFFVNIEDLNLIQIYLKVNLIWMRMAILK